MGYFQMNFFGHKASEKATIPLFFFPEVLYSQWAEEIYSRL